MIIGRVSATLEPKISLMILDSTDSPLLLDVLIDTGFTGFLALRSDLVEHLGLQRIAKVPVELADGSEVSLHYHFVRIEWRGVVRTVRAIEMDTDPVIGTQLLWGNQLTIDMIVDGVVTVTPLP